MVCGLEQLNLKPGFSGGRFFVSSEMTGHSARQQGSRERQEGLHGVGSAFPADSSGPGIGGAEVSAVE